MNAGAVITNRETKYCRWDYAGVTTFACIQLWGKRKGKNKKLLSVTGVLAFVATIVVVIFLEIFATPISRLFIRDVEEHGELWQYLSSDLKKLPAFQKDMEMYHEVKTKKLCSCSQR